MDKKTYKENCSALREDGFVTEVGENDNLIIEKLTDNSERFGILVFFLDQNRDRVQGSFIDGIEPSFDNIAMDYKVSRPLYFMLKRTHWCSTWN